MNAPAWIREIGWLVIRLAFGLMLMSHGLDKLYGQGPDGVWGVASVAQVIGGTGLPAPWVLAWGLTLAEILGGLGMAVGLFTPLSAGVAAIAMAAVLGYHVSHGHDFRNYELALHFLAVTLGTMIFGAGRYSLDRHWHTRFAPPTSEL